jgi:hypothetical protein
VNDLKAVQAVAKADEDRMPPAARADLSSELDGDRHISSAVFADGLRGSELRLPAGAWLEWGDVWSDHEAW